MSVLRQQAQGANLSEMRDDFKSRANRPGGREQRRVKGLVASDPFIAFLALLSPRRLLGVRPWPTAARRQIPLGPPLGAGRRQACRHGSDSGRFAGQFSEPRVGGRGVDAPQVDALVPQPVQVGP